MHRIWRVVLVGMICAVLAWPSLGMAYVRDIVEAHAIIDEAGNTAASTSSNPDLLQSQDSSDSESGVISWFLDSLVYWTAGGLPAVVLLPSGY